MHDTHFTYLYMVTMFSVCHSAKTHGIGTLVSADIQKPKSKKEKKIMFDFFLSNYLKTVDKL